MKMQRVKFSIYTALLVLCSLLGVTAASAQTPVIIHVGWPWGPDAQQTTGFIDMVNAFNREHSDIRVEYTLAYDHDKFVVSMAGGAAPDVYSIGGIGSYIEAGYTADITDLVERDTRLSKDDFVPAAWNRVTPGGRVWALPYSADPNFAFFTNRAHLDEAGMVASDIRTIADVDQAHLRLTRRAPDGLLERAGIIPVDVIGGYINDINTWGWLFGGSFYDEATQTVTPDHDGVVEALEWMVEHNQRISEAEIASAFGGGFWDRFTREKVSMWPANPPQLGNIRNGNPDLIFDVTPMPKHPNGPDNPTWIGGHNFAVTSTSAHREAAYEFIRYAAASPEGSRLLLAPTGFFPAYKKSNVVEQYLADDKTALFIELLQTAYLPGVDIPAYTDYVAALTSAVQAALNGTQAPRVALEEVRRIVQPKVDEAIARAASQR